jgi:MFS family permease
VGTGLLIEYAPDPTRLVFGVLAALFLVLTVVTAALPETVQRTPGAFAALRPQVAVPARARRAFAAAVPTMISTWALGGLMLSVGGSLLESTFGQANHAVVGLVLGVFALSAAVVGVLARDLSPTRMTRAGTSVLALGTAVFVLALVASSVTLFVIAAVVAGAGFGSGFLGAFRTVSQLAEPHERAALLSAVYVVSYLAFSIPALIAGVLISHVGLRDTSLGYGALVAAVAVCALGYEFLGRSVPATEG